MELVSGFDLFLVAETKLDTTDLIDISGYEFISKPRQQPSLRRSGGLGLFVKAELSKYIETIQSESDYVLWVKLDKSYMQSDKHIVFGIVYVPPTQSRFLNEDEFEIFQNEITDMSCNFDYIYLAGDWNAQTANLADYTTGDDFLSKHFDFDDELSSFYHQKAALEKLGIEVNRKSMDNKRNNNGFKLLDICKNNNLSILNGRFGADKNVGNYTFRRTSVIDYVISSLQGLNILKNFNITELDRLYSDGHSLLSFEIMLQKPNTHDKKRRQNIEYPVWENTKAQSFVDKINLLKLQDIMDQFSTESEHGTRSQEAIDMVTNQISNLFAESASQSFVSKPKLHKSGNARNKPWFGPACHHTRKAYNVAKRKYNRERTHRNLQNLQRASKIYKNTMNKFINKHNKNNETRLRNMHNKRPKDYWKILNSVKNRTTKEMPDAEIFYDYFKDCNLPNYDPEDISDIPTNNEYLNSPITSAEIEKCISCLKNSKSPGTDCILNEYIKSTKGILLPLYEQLFNTILNTGIIPTAWVEGIIIPLYKNKGDTLDVNNYRPITLLSCLGKLFTAVLNNRLSTFLEDSGTYMKIRQDFGMPIPLLIIYLL